MRICPFTKKYPNQTHPSKATFQNKRARTTLWQPLPADTTWQRYDRMHQRLSDRWCWAQKESNPTNGIRMPEALDGAGGVSSYGPSWWDTIVNAKHRPWTYSNWSRLDFDRMSFFRYVKFFCLSIVWVMFLLCWVIDKIVVVCYIVIIEHGFWIWFNFFFFLEI